MERALVRARLAEPAALGEADYQALRYALGLARLTALRPAPGAADVALGGAALRRLRAWLLERLEPSLRAADIAAVDRLGACREAAPKVAALTATARAELLATHANDFDAQRLDAEAGERALVSVAGGGGGAGFVYLGAYARLDAAGLTPDYIVGNSIGAVAGLFRASQRRQDPEETLAFAKSLRRSSVFAAGRRRADLCLPGLLQLHLKALHARFVVGEHRRPLRMEETEIPLDLVVAGVKRRRYEEMAPEVRNPEVHGKPGPFSLKLAARLWRLASFISPSLVTPLVLGGDADTRQLHAVDVVGFSAAVPTILQYELRGRAGASREIYAELLQRHDLSALVDGGVADNVPARAAWRGVAAGRIGRRNAYILAFDCFTPKWEPKHLWLWPIAQAVQMQMRANRVYADTMVRFAPTLSPVNLVPAPASLDTAFGWGWTQMEKHLPEVTAMLAPAAPPPAIARAS